MSKHTPEPWVADDRHDLDTNFTQMMQQARSLADARNNILVHRDIEERRANARRIVTCVNACAGMEDPAAEIAELKRQRDELLGLVKAVSYHSIPATVDGIKCAAFPWSEYESMVKKAKGSVS